MTLDEILGKREKACTAGVDILMKHEFKNLSPEWKASLIKENKQQLELLSALRKAIAQRDDLLSGLVRSDLDHIEEWREESDTELASILKGEGG